MNEKMQVIKELSKKLGINYHSLTVMNSGKIKMVIKFSNWVKTEMAVYENFGAFIKTFFEVDIEFEWWMDGLEDFS